MPAPIPAINVRFFLICLDGPTNLEMMGDQECWSARPARYLVAIIFCGIASDALGFSTVPKISNFASPSSLHSTHERVLDLKLHRAESTGAFGLRSARSAFPSFEACSSRPLGEKHKLHPRGAQVFVLLHPLFHFTILLLLGSYSMSSRTHLSRPHVLATLVKKQQKASGPKMQVAFWSLSAD